MPSLRNRADDESSHFSDHSSSSDDSSYDDDMQSDHTPIINLAEILSSSSSSSSSVEDDDQSSQSTPTTESMQQLIDSIIRGDPATDNETNSVSESSSDGSSSDSDDPEPPNYDPNNTGAEFRHMIMRNSRNPRPLNPFQTPDTTHQANAVTVHTAMATRAKRHKRQEDPSESTLGSPSCILNWLCDTGASAHMTPRLDDLRNIELVDSVNVQVADGYVVPITHSGDVILNMDDQNGVDFEVTLKRVFYVPGLTQRLLSIPAFSAAHGNSAHIKNSFITLSWHGQKVTCPISKNTNPFFTAVPAQLKHVGLTTNAQDERKALPIELVHQRLGHTKTNTLLYTSQHLCWANVVVVMGPEKLCDPCQVVTTRSNNRCKIPPSNPL